MPGDHFKNITIDFGFQFPFYLNGKEYNTCTMDYTSPGETPWCATRVTSNCFPLTSTNQVDGMGNMINFGSAAWGYCESNCPTDTDSSDSLACPHSVSQNDVA